MRVGNAERVRSWGWLFPALWCGLIIVASSVPNISAPRGFYGRDKFIHVIEFAVLGALVVISLAERFSLKRWLLVAMALGVCVAFGGLDEAYQGTVQGREADLYDLVWDAVGATAASVFIVLVWRRRG